MNVFWATSSALAGAAGILGAVLSYYPQRSLVWRQIASRVAGLKHVGVFLESGFLALLAAAGCVLAGFVYSDTSATLLAGGLRSLVFTSLVGAGALTSVFLHLFVLPGQWCEEYRARFPHRVAKLEAAGRWEGHCAAVHGIYRTTYWAYGTATLCLLILVFTVIALGIYDDFGIMSVSGQTLRAAATAVDTSALPADGLGQCHIAVAAHMAYQADLLNMTSHALVAAAMLSFALYWFVGTRFQEIFGPAAVNWGRVVTILLIFIGVPALLLFGWYELVQSCQIIDRQVVALAANARDAGVSAGVPDLAELSQYLDERCSVSGFLARVAAGWGGVLFCLQFVLSYAQKKLLNESIYSNVVPSFRSLRWLADRMKVMLTTPDAKS